MGASRHHRRDRGGFSLVEVALALMVVGVGMVAIFSVLPAGMDSNKKAINEAYAAMFAEEVFNGIRAKSQFIPWAQIDAVTIDPAAPDMWNNLSTMRVKGNTTGTVIYEAKTEPPIQDYALRYSLQIRDVAPDIKLLRLIVWNGQYGSSNALGDGLTFYTEIFNTGR